MNEKEDVQIGLMQRRVIRDVLFLLSWVTLLQPFLYLRNQREEMEKKPYSIACFEWNVPF